MNPWLVLLPEGVLAAAIALVLILDLAGSANIRRWSVPAVALLGTLLAIAAVWIVPEGQFFQAMRHDLLAKYTQSIVLAATALIVLAAWDFDQVWQRPLGEFMLLLLSAALGMMFMAGGTELVLLYIGLELATFPMVLLTAYQPANIKSAEGGLKYLILAAVGTALFLFGISLIYSQTGITQIYTLAQQLVNQTANPIVLTGMLAMLAGVGLKIAMVPFHMWAPDAYEGAPTPVTAYLSVASKTAGFVLALRLFGTAFPALRADWGTVLAALAAVTMTLGNFAAIPQTNIKRLFAYSSISQAGYMIMGLVAFDTIGISGLLYFLVAYLVTNLGAFAVVIALERKTGSTDISTYHGLAQESPRLSLLMLLALLSLAGIPPLAGFSAKFYLFATVFSQGWVWLVVVAILNSALSIYYYLKVVKAIYIFPPSSQPALAHGTDKNSATLSLVMIITFLGILAVGIYPGPWVQAALKAAQSLF